MNAPELSIISPVFNEEDNLAPLVQQLVGVLCPLNRAYELIFVDDASTDGSHAKLRELQERHPEIRVLRHLKNSGESAAELTGFRHARGQIIVTIDSDLQNDPADIPAMLHMLETCDIVCDNTAVSREHAKVYPIGGRVVLVDLKSKNGTYVNNERVAGERELKPGDHLTIGPLHFEVLLAHGIATKKQPPVGDVKEAVARTAHNAAKDPLDIDQWLVSEATEETVGHASQQRPEVNLNDTDSISLSSTQTLTGVPKPELPAEDGKHLHHDPAHPPGKKTPGKLPTVPASTKDSQDAASAMLSKLRKKR